MNLKHFDAKLLAKQRDTQQALAALETEARGTGDVGDSIDAATLSQSTGEASDEGGILSGILVQVEDALTRLKDGSYGICLDCGRPIEAARLEAVPWASFCLADQETRDGGPATGYKGPTL